MILEGRTVVVSGVGAGLGAEVARCAHRDGARVMLAARTAANLEALQRELDPAGERVAWQTTDIGDAAACERLAAAAEERFGGVDALVNVAALDTLFGGLMDGDVEQWAPTFEANVFGTAKLVKAMAPALERRGGGSVVLVGSQSALLPLVPQIAYASSKGALLTAMRFMARELGPKKIRVNTVIPTWMWGPPVEGYLKGVAEQRGISLEEAIREVTVNMPLGEIPADEDVAEACVFFCSDRARMITGQSLLVNAGEFMP